LGFTVLRKNSMHKDEKTIRETWFQNHVAQQKFFTCDDVGVIQKILWYKPGTRFYSVSYLYYQGKLFVSGDTESATYEWHHKMSLGSIAQCNLDYFHGKCQASPVGRDYSQWSEKKAKSFLEDYFEQYFLEHLDFNPDVDRHGTDTNRQNKKGFIKKYIKTEIEKITKNMFFDESPLSSSTAWKAFLGEHGHDFFGDSYYEHSNIGKEVDIQCRGHKIGLEMAFLQLAGSS
jgi:hypothetical protein